MSKTYYAIADCKHGIKPQFCLACAKEKIVLLEGLLKAALAKYSKNCGCMECESFRKVVREILE